MHVALRTRSLSITKLFLACVLIGAASRAAAQPAADDPAATARSFRWQQRDTPEARAATAQEFLKLLVLDETQRRNTGLFTRKDLAEVARLQQAGQYAAALDVFARYYLDKLRYPTRYGIAPFDVDPFAVGVCGRGGYPSTLDPAADPAAVRATAEKLLGNVVRLGGKEFALGPPGAVNWNLPFGRDEALPPDEQPAPALLSAQCFAPLVHAYLLTHHQRYLDKWIDFLDDWSLNCRYVDTIHPCLVPDSAGGSTIPLIRLLGGLARAMPADRPVLPPRVLAQMLRKRICEYELCNVAYTRSNTHNWTPSPCLFLTAMLLDEFQAAPRLLREARRRNIEDNAVTQNLRDGSENQQCPWYNSAYLYVAGALRLLEARGTLPVWADVRWLAELRSDVAWQNEIRAHLRERITYLVHLRTPQGEWPIPVRGGSKREADWGDFADAPDAFAEPQNLAIWKAITAPAAGVRPAYTSEWFPYGGYNLVRDGWERDSAHGELFCSPQPGAYGGFRSRSNNNNFGLGACGQDLLIDDNTFGHYMHPSSPLTVDGKNQFFHAGIYKVPKPAGHKVFQVSAWLEPAPWRWHASQRFNLMEGVYAGPYANPDDRRAVDGPFGKDESMQGTIPLDQTLRGMTHQRLVLYARAAKLWIVTDRLRAAGRHRYEQLWYLPAVPSPTPAFQPQDLTLDAAHRQIRTQATEFVPGPHQKPVPKANVSLHQFTAATLTYGQRVVPPPPRPDGRILMWGWLRVAAAWTGDGNQQVVTAILPRAPGAGPECELREVREITTGRAGRGFQALAPDGSLVQYVASPEPDDECALGLVRAQAEALLLVGRAGLVLGCRALHVGGQPVAVPTADFEFELSDTGLARMTPIYRPIDPVQIGPARNVFTDAVEVTLASRTPGVEIRYTLDGGDPTPQSPLYRGPFPLTASAVVKARAYRPGVSENPPQLSGTHATVASMAVFDKTAALDAEKFLKTVPGLRCRYWEDDWKKLWLGIDELPPRALGVVANLWDFRLVPADNRPLGEQPAPRAKYYALEYSGYLDVPADGVYTLHAPRECVWPDTAAGYELRVYLGHKIDPRTRWKVGLNEWYPATRLHALGNWSIALERGPHPLRVVWIDFRTDAAGRLNRPGLREYVWTGVAPELRISGPNLDRQPIPAAWLRHTEPPSR